MPPESSCYISRLSFSMLLWLELSNIEWKGVFMTRFRTGIINWPGEWVLLSGSGGGLHSRISSSNIIPQKVKENSLSCVWLFATPWTIAYQASQSMAFSRQEYWSELSFPSPGDLVNPGTEPGSLTFQADSLPSEPPGKVKVKSLSCRGPAPVDPGWFEGGGLESASLEKYIFNHRYREIRNG